MFLLKFHVAFHKHGININIGRTFQIIYIEAHDAFVQLLTLHSFFLLLLFINMGYIYGEMNERYKRASSLLFFFIASST